MLLSPVRAAASASADVVALRTSWGTTSRWSRASARHVCGSRAR